MTASVEVEQRQTRLPDLRLVRWPLVIAGVFLAVVVVSAVLPWLLAPASPLDADPLNALQPPSAAHPFGTDQLGRDVYTRVVHGAGSSLLVGFGGTGLAVLAGTLIGLSAGLGGRVLDAVLMRIVDILLALPGLLLALIVLAVLGQGQFNVLIAVAISATAPYARLVRGQVMSVRGSGYVEASVGLGLGQGHIVLRHVVPNSVNPVLVLATIGTGTAIIHGASLSFLGLGPPPPAPEWGAMLAEATGYLSVAWWTAFFPGIVVTGTVAAVTVIGRALRARLDRLDPS